MSAVDKVRNIANGTVHEFSIFDSLDTYSLNLTIEKAREWGLYMYDGAVPCASAQAGSNPTRRVMLVAEELLNSDSTICVEKLLPLWDETDAGKILLSRQENEEVCDEQHPWFHLAKKLKEEGFGVLVGEAEAPEGAEGNQPWSAQFYMTW